MTEAIQSDRKSGSPSGAQGEMGCFRVGGSTTGILIISAMTSVVSRWSLVVSRQSLANQEIVILSEAKDLLSQRKSSLAVGKSERLATND
jgi:hypothetical protein